MFKKVFYISVLITLLAIIALVYFTFTYRAQSPVGQTNDVPSPTVAEEPTPTPEIKSVYRYELVRNRVEDYEWSHSTFDGSIVRIHTETGERITVVPSIKEAYPDIKSAINTTLMPLSSPPNSDEIYFTKILSETDAPPMDIISFNAVTKQFAKLKISSYWQGFHPKEVVKDGFLAFSTYNPANPEDGRSLFQLDLKQDTAKLRHSLSASETFNQCYNDTCFGGFSGEIRWGNPWTIYANVYHSGQTVTDANTGVTTYKLKETLTIVPN